MAPRPEAVAGAGAAGAAEVPVDAPATGFAAASATVVPASPTAAMVSAAVTANLPPAAVKNVFFRMSESPPRNGREHCALQERCPRKSNIPAHVRAIPAAQPPFRGTPFLVQISSPSVHDYVLSVMPFQ